MRHAEADRGRWINVEGARTHNLRDVSVRVPKHRLTVFTGVSGSGKSSLAFDTIAAEAERTVMASYPAFVRNRLAQHPLADVDRIDGLTFTTLVDQRPFSGNARSTVGTASDLAPLLRVLFSRAGRPSAGFSPAYSFNDPSGMCPRCEGLGVIDDVLLDELVDRSMTLRQGAIRFPTFAPGTYRWKRLMDSGLADVDTPLGDLPDTTLHTLLYAEGLTLSSPAAAYPKHGIFDGVVPRIRDSYLRTSPSRLTTEEKSGLDRVVSRQRCADCGGSRLNAAARGSLIHGRSIADWSRLPIDKLPALVRAVAEPGVAPVVAAVTERLDALAAVGLGYLSLERESATLSGGEAQRVKIVRHLGSPLSEVTYAFDEPSAGLHPHDVQRLLDLLLRLRDAHNTILVVEHQSAFIAAADHVIDLGPGGGTEGGELVIEGSPTTVARSNTLTGRVLREPIRLKPATRLGDGVVKIAHARRHNLKDVSVNVPLGVLTAVTGVAGSGKSTLFADELPRQHVDFAVVDQSPLHGGTRSTAATVLGVAEPIRAVFAQASGLGVSWFSANGRGACPVCKGKGVVVTDLAFLDDVRTACDACGGSRFNPRALGVAVRGHRISDVLAMTAGDAADLFSSEAAIVQPLDWVRRVGLDYLAIGQGLDTFSGGERQRLRLARHLATVRADADLRIVLDEPSAGLHGADVGRLVRLLNELVEDGATVVAIEHKLHVVAAADHVIDVGPGAGHDGGAVVYEGSPDGLTRAPGSITGQYLRAAIESRWADGE
ncbi:excinuclease ABC subunit UvrA [Flexivirga meconopsidis]|uniref:excinuclease ABC subunit UvrA n=1 Tax=Flexivirga meconopsidis TaxID=2977121 RepID=UPI00223ED919|nr:excinuclease ABC subunit UvrA [Flexivirga meconopsidis]